MRLINRVSLLILWVCMLSPVAWSSENVVFAEQGRDVGDGNVLYDTPYDPNSVDEVSFYFPTSEHPYYEIVLPLGDWDEGKSATVKEIRVNGVNCESFYVFVDGYSHVQSGWITKDSPNAKNVVVVARSLWHNDTETKVEMDITAQDEEGNSKEVKKEFTARSPKKGGGPKGWRRYQSLALHEKVGVDRKNEPVEFSVTVRKENCGDLAKELRVFEVGKEGDLTPVGFQTFDEQSFGGTPPGTSNENYLQHPSESLSAIFLASVPANESRVFTVVYDNPDAPEPPMAKTDLTVEGPPVGAVVENDFYRIKLDDKCGQIVSFELKGREDNPAPKLTNSLSLAAHWNPDSFSDNGKWGHTFAWDPPEKTVVSARGPILFRVTNSGRMPDWTPQVHATVSYSFYASNPYVGMKTITEVRDPLNANAIRNGELVLDSHMITHFVWGERNGEIHQIRTAHGPNWQDEWATRVDQDVRWLAMTNELDDYGVGVSVQNSLSFNPIRGEATTHRQAYYIYYHHFWSIPVTYFTRGWVYPFSDYQRGPILPAHVGSTYVEDSAFVPFYLGEEGKRYETIETVSEQLKNPLSQRWGR
ncbi:MAG: hypothetical protein KC940_19205 [Candidatus Omnitrophica bacterium]|nr:hypothetical protein [Candidatus Omnitrophota bacterium]